MERHGGALAIVRHGSSQGIAMGGILANVPTEVKSREVKLTAITP